MENVVEVVVSKLDPSSLLLVVVLFGVWKLAREALEAFRLHADKVGGSLEKMAEDCHELRRDMSQIARTVAVHEVRLGALERGRD
jgi:hypothetical protein